MDKQTLGFVFGYGGKHYRLLDLQFGSDNSFYFIPSQHEAEVGQHLEWHTDENGVVVFDPSKVISGGFPTRKISRHPSGYLHIKDVVGPGGNREKDGLKGPAFSGINGSHVILVAFPQRIDSLVEIGAPNPATDLVVGLPDSIEPFTVQFAVWDKKTPPDKFVWPQPILGGGGVVMQSNEQPYGLIAGLFAIAVTGPAVTVPFPQRTVYLVQ